MIRNVLAALLAPLSRIFRARFDPAGGEDLGFAEFLCPADFSTPGYRAPESGGVASPNDTLRLPAVFAS